MIALNRRKAFITGGIVIIPSHVMYAQRIFQDCLKQTISFDEIHVVASGITKEQETQLVESVPRQSLHLFHFHFFPPGSAGKNRNRILEVIPQHTNLLIFHDADDRYFRYRNETILKMAQFEEPGVLLHLTIPTFQASEKVVFEVFDVRTLNEIPRLFAKDLFEANYPSKTRKRKNEFLGIESTSLKFPDNEMHQVHHGHLSIVNPSAFPIRFHEDFYPRNEDSLFVRDALFQKLNIEILLVPLSVYILGTSGQSKRYFLQRFLLRIRKLFGLLSGYLVS